MLKSTEIKLANEKKRNEIYRDEVSVLKEKNHIDEEHNKYQMEHSDRVNVSLKKYEELVKENEKLGREVANLKGTLMKFIDPLIINKVDDKLIAQIANNDFKCNIHFFHDFPACKYKIIYTIEVDDLCLR